MCSRALVGRRTLAAGLAATCLASSAAHAQPVERVGLLIDRRSVPTYAGVVLAQQSHAFARRGLDVQLVEGHDDVTAVRAVGAGGRYWIGLSTAVATAIGRSRGLPVRSLAVYQRRDPAVIYSRSEDRIDLPRHLYGQRVGVVGGSSTLVKYRAFLMANRLDRQRIGEIEVMRGPHALLDGEVDALVDNEEGDPTLLQADGHRVSMMRLAGLGVRTYGLNLIVNEGAWADPRFRSAARLIAEALAEGYQNARDYPIAASTLLQRLFPDLSPRYLELAMQIVGRQMAEPVGGQSRLGWDDTLTTLRTLGALATAVSVEEMAIFETIEPLPRPGPAFRQMSR